MTKDEAKIKLRKEGYNVVDDNSVVTVLISSDSSVSKTVKEVEEKLKTYGYEASFSVKQVAEGNAIPAEEEADDMSGDNVSDDYITMDYAEEPLTTEEVDVGSAESSSADADDESEDNKKDDPESPDRDDIEYYDEDDSDMLLTEDAVQFSLDDFGLDF